MIVVSLVRDETATTIFLYLKVIYARILCRWGHVHVHLGHLSTYTKLAKIPCFDRDRYNDELVPIVIGVAFGSSAQAVEAIA